MTLLLGIEEQLEGTMLEYLNNLGAVTLGFEGGQHVSQEAIDNHEALVWLALVNSGILAPEDAPSLARHQETLAKATGKSRFVEIRYRHPVKPADEFRMKPGYENFQPVRRGELLAEDKGGAIRAKENGLILMPLYQKLGADGFFLGREIAPFWLRLSEILRNAAVADWMPLLPGVRLHPKDKTALIVNTRIARLFPLQIFHLLGFRHRRWQAHKLVVSRRRHDTKSPFRKGD